MANTRLEVPQRMLSQRTLFTVVRPKARHNHPMIVGDLFDVWLDEFRAVHEATLPFEFER
jgi:hypothetical protein